MKKKSEIGKDRDHIISGSDNRLAFSVYICDLLLF